VKEWLGNKNVSQSKLDQPWERDFHLESVADSQSMFDEILEMGTYFFIQCSVLLIDIYLKIFLPQSLFLNSFSVIIITYFQPIFY
jgi:hypothetical protein